MDPRPTLDENTPLSPRPPRTPPVPFPAEYTSLNFTTESLRTDPPPSYSSFQKSFVRNYSLPYSTPDISAVKANAHGSGKSRSDESWRIRITKLVTDWWLFEILSWSISASCMCAIVALLGVWNDHPLPSKWPRGISLNAAISVLSAIAKMTLTVPVEEAIGQLKWIWFQQGQARRLIDLERFDDASRGPWGSLSLIMHMRGRSLASLGGIVILLSLALDPFFQQLTAYPKRPSLFGKSLLTRSVIWQTQDTHGIRNGVKVSGPDYLLSPALEFAFLAHGEPLKNPNPCPSNNCEWPAFETLGVCSQCEDISDLLTFGCLAESGTWRLTNNYTIPPINQEPPPLAQVTSCGWFMNASSPDPMLMTGYVRPSNVSQSPGEALWMRSINLNTPILNHSYWDRSYRFRNVMDALPLFDFMIAAQIDVASVYANKPPQALECVLRWCTKTIAASVVDGNYTETVLSTFTNDTAQPYPIPDDWRPGRPNGTDVDGYTANISITPPGQGETFSVPHKVVFQAIIPFSANIPAYYTSANISADPQVRYNEIAGVWTSTTKNVDKSRWVAPGNLSAYAEHIATTMTNVMRSYPNSSESVPGYGGVETYIHIQWSWLCLPLIVLFSTLLVLVATIWKGSARTQGGIWKTSSLAMLLHGLDEKTRQDIGDSWSVFEMKSKAREISVTLRPELDGYRFHRVGVKSEKV